MEHPLSNSVAFPFLHWHRISCSWNRILINGSEWSVHTFQCHISVHSDGHIKAECLISSQMAQRHFGSLMFARYSAIQQCLGWWRSLSNDSAHHTPIIHQTQQTLSETMLTDAHDCLFLTNNLISLMLNPFSTHIKSSLTTRSLRTALLQPLPNQHYTYDGHLP